MTVFISSEGGGLELVIERGLDAKPRAECTSDPHLSLKRLINSVDD